MVARSWRYEAILLSCLHCLLGLVLCLASGAARGQTANLDVVATVEASCELRGGTLNFGTFRSEEGTTGQTTVGYTCPPGMRIGLTMSQGRQPKGQRRAMVLDGGGATLLYQLFQDAARQQVWGDHGDALVIDSTADGDATVSVYGAVEAGQQVPPGTYRDTVLITLVIDP